MVFDNFSVVDFPPPEGSLVGHVGGHVYVFFWIQDSVEVPFYVGQTRRLAGRMDDYRCAQFAACTDFRVGEAARYFRDVKHFRVVVRYKHTPKQAEEEYLLIRRLQTSGVRLLNDLVGYDYRTAHETGERKAVRKFCEVLIQASGGRL